MPGNDAPKIDFSEWVSWSDRSSLLRSDGPWLGVYLWAHFKRPLSQPTKPYPNLPSQVIYVGETKDIDQRPLTREHHRIVHYRDTFPDDPDLVKLYLSVCRVRRFGAGYSSKKAKGVYSRLRVYTVH